MEKKFREGSMGAADAKNQKIAVLVLGGILFVIYLLFVLPTNLYPHYWFKNASGISKAAGILSALGHLGFMWFKFRKIQEEANSFPSKTVLALIGWLVLNIFLLSGFNFDLPPGA